MRDSSPFQRSRESSASTESTILSTVYSLGSSPESTGVVGWSTSMETPPQSKRTEDILVQLRGNPRSALTRLSTDLESLQFEPSVMASSTERERSIHTDNHQDVREEGDGCQAKASTTTSSLYDPAASSATTAGSVATQRVSGFKTGEGIPLTASKAARERAAELLAENDMETRTFTGFKTGKGIPLVASKAARERAAELLAENDTETQTFTGFKTRRDIPLAASKAARERVEDFFAEDDTDNPRIPKTPGHVKTVPSIQPAQFKDFRFSSGKGNALASSTEFALANPHGIHARNLEPIKPDLVGNRLPSITPPEHTWFSIGASSAAPQPPAIPPHMINLGLKSLRAATSGSSQPGLMKSKMPFKSPMKRPLASTTVGGPSNARSSTGDNTSAEDVSPSKNSSLDKSHTGKRVLHPNARITSIAQPPSVTHAPRYTSLFHLPGMLNGFEYVAPGGYVSKGVI